MNQIPEEINLTDWEEFGGGFTASSFYHKTDDSIMMKLYAPFMSKTEALTELELSEKVLNLGLPVAEPIAYVKSNDGRFGAVFKRLKNKRSLARILSEEPDRLDEMAKIFAEESKKLHQTKCDTNAFEEYGVKVVREITSAEFIPEYIKEKARIIVDATPVMDTCIHGDLHIGNLLMVDGKPIFIDLGDFSYGNPLYDLGCCYFQLVYGDPNVVLDMFHVSIDVTRKFWDCFIRYYYEDIDNIEVLMKPYLFLGVAKYAAKIGRLPDALKSILDTCL